LKSLQKNVIVIGAGPSGLAAARQLQNFGTQVNKNTLLFSGKGKYVNKNEKIKYIPHIAAILFLRLRGTL